jgi:uncharacterized protein (DUF1697 family)
VAETWIAMLRGINLGSRKRVSMADLKALVEGLDADNVRTYLQSGNVVFETSRRSQSTLANAITRAIASDLGLDVVVALRSADEMARVVQDNPFGRRPGEQLHVTFLTRTPRADDVTALVGGEYDPDDVAVKGHEVYLHCPAGYGRTRLSNDFLEKRLGVAATTRNWRTVTALDRLANA